MNSVQILELEGHTRNIILFLEYCKLSLFLNIFILFRIDQLFDIIVEYPDSLPAIQDLKVCGILFRILVFKVVATSCFSFILPNFLLFVRLFILYCRLHGHSSF